MKSDPPPATTQDASGHERCLDELQARGNDLLTNIHAEKMSVSDTGGVISARHNLAERDAALDCGLIISSWYNTFVREVERIHRRRFP